MAFVRLMCKAANLEKRKFVLEDEKKYASSLPQDGEHKISFKQRYRHRCMDFKRKIKKLLRKCFTFPEKTYIYRFFYKLRNDGSCENYVLKSIAGFIGGFLITYVFFMFFVFQLNFKFSTATLMCSIFGSILTIGLAFSYKVRCIVFLTLPQLFSKRGRQALLAYAFILAITGPAKNTLNNMGILSESLACGQEQLKQAVKQILEVIKKPFYAIRDAIRKVVQVVKTVVKKIKEILLAIKRVVVAIIKVIKAVFQFLAKVVNICNKELGTPFQRCVRVFENAITDCQAKLGPTFSWLCSITYLVQSVCYMVKWFDFVCSLIDFISNNIVGVVVKKIKNFIRHIKTMFYVRIKFSHSFHFETNASKSLEDVATGIITEIKERTEGLVKIFDFMSCATSLFFMFIVFRVVYYRYKFLTDERFDNRFINKDFRTIDTRRAQLGKETVLPLNQRERNVYISVGSMRLVKKEKLKLSQSAVVLGMATLKLATHMMADYALFWVLMLIRKHASFQSTFEGTKIPTLQVKGEGFLADLLRSIVKAFQPVGIRLEIDTVPCLPDPIPPDYDRYVQIASLLVICWILTLFEPYGLRWRHSVMCFYHPTRGRQRAIWLYNHILRTRSSFLKFARRQLRRKFRKDHSIAKITCKEYLAANLTERFKILRFCIKPKQQLACLLCGEIFRDDDTMKPIKCQTPGCLGVYCEQCFQDLQNLCTICLDPIQYGDLSDVSEEKDSSGDEASVSASSKKKRNYKLCKKICSKDEPKDDDDGSGDDTDDDKDDNDKTDEIASDSSTNTKRATDSDYYSTDTDTDTFDYQYKKDVTQKAVEPPQRTFADLEKQEIPDYASMESFRESSSTKATIGSERMLEDLDKVGDQDTSPSRKKFSYFKRLNLFKFRKRKQEELPLLKLDSTTDEETTDSTYIDSDVPKKMIKTMKRIPWYKKKRKSSSTETTYIETPKIQSPKRKLPSNIFIPSDNETPRKKQRIETKEAKLKEKYNKPLVPEGVPKLDLDFDSCRCDNPSCTPHPCICKMLDKKVKFHTETETSSKNSSVRSVTFLSSSISDTVETSPTSQTTTVTESLGSSQTSNETSTHEPINYLYGVEDNAPFIDQNKSRPHSVKFQRSDKGETLSNTTVSDTHIKSFKKKVNSYYKKINKEYTDTPEVKKDRQSKFTKFLNRLLRKDIFDRSSTRPRLTKSFLSESDETSPTTLPTHQERQKLETSANVWLRSPTPAKSQSQAHSVGTYFFHTFFNIFMGACASTEQNSRRKRTHYNNLQERGSDESLHVIAEKFGYYDSTDSDISELHFPVLTTRKQLFRTSNKSLENETDEETNTKEQDIKEKTESIQIDEKITEREGKGEQEITETEVEVTDYTDGSITDSKRITFKDTPSNESQMNIEGKRSSLDRQNSTRYSREPPERDQNYEDKLKKSCCQCRHPGDCKRQQEYNPCCQHNSRRNICPNQYCVDRRPQTTYDLAKGTTYDLAKSVENLRRNEYNKFNNYGSQHKRGQQSRSSPEVNKNRLPMKPNEMTNNDNSEYIYNDFMQTRPINKNDCYAPNQDHMKNRYPPKYPYEEPLHDENYNNENHDRNCACEICTRRVARPEHYRNCKCCECLRTKRPMDDQLSSYSEESQGLNLAYQKAEEYPILVDEIENTISMRNKERVRRTMRQFELLSRQNKGLDKPIYDDDEEENSSNRFACNKRNPPFNRPRSNEANRSYCYDRSGNYQTRSECLSERPAYAATPFPRNRGYVEKVARYMDPSMNDNTQKYQKFQNEYTNTKWQMDPRSGEWVKVYDSYDFESNYPPLPPTPSPMYHDYDNYPKNQQYHNYYNAPSHRSASPMKHTMNKPCSCRNCMGSQSNNRY